MNQHAKNRYQAGLRAQAPPPPPPPPPVIAPDVEPLSAGRHAFPVTEEQAGGRLDRVLAEMAAGVSRTRVKSLIESGYVEINDVRALDSGAKVRLGQTISINIPEPAAAEPAGESIPLVVVFEDEHLIIIDKPAGLVVHPSAGHETGTLVNALIAHCGESLSGIGGVKRPGIVHRLDKDTTGLLVVAKTDVAHQGLAALFADHGRTMNFTREYIAFVWRVPERRKGTIDAPLARHGTNREKQAVIKGDRGREAITHYAVEAMYCVDADGKPLASRIRCALETGRTHQIRVHLAHAGCPVMGDPLYSMGFKSKVSVLPEKAQQRMAFLRRQALHAAVLGFTHPVTGKDMRFESKLPEDLRELQKALAAG
jgi:23S rRNA pseudouridine1911/1915/1917 synthase